MFAPQETRDLPGNMSPRNDAQFASFPGLPHPLSSSHFSRIPSSSALLKTSLPPIFVGRSAPLLISHGSARAGRDSSIRSKPGCFMASLDRNSICWRRFFRDKSAYACSAMRFAVAELRLFLREHGDICDYADRQWLLPNSGFAVRLEMDLVARASRDFEHQGRKRRSRRTSGSSTFATDADAQESRPLAAETAF
jgi:hypothetical protein